MKILVIGAGVSGLSSAVCIQEKFPNVRVTIKAERFPPEDIVSMVAGGVILGTPDTNMSQNVVRALKDTCHYFLELAKDNNDLIHGVVKRDGYWLISTETYGETVPDDLRPISSQVFGKAVPLSAQECRKIMPERTCSGWQVLTTVVDNRRYLPYLLNKFHNNGGQIVRGRVDNLSQVSDDYDVIVNCTALSSRELVNDESVYPVKGQLIRFDTQGKVNNFIYCVNMLDDATKALIGYYYIPHSFDTVVGGTYQFGNESRYLDSETMNRLERFARNSHPGFKNAPIISKYTGVRPARVQGSRIEKEAMEINGKVIQVIHNYGHGGYGVGLSWGSATQVTELLSEVMARSKL